MVNDESPALPYLPVGNISTFQSQCRQIHYPCWIGLLEMWDNLEVHPPGSHFWFEPGSGGIGRGGGIPKSPCYILLFYSDSFNVDLFLHYINLPLHGIKKCIQVASNRTTRHYYETLRPI